jgi:phage/plasmid-like protein (TIGR03299 family)
MTVAADHGTLYHHDRKDPYGICGVKLAGVTDAGEALRLGQLDWQVELHPLQAVVETTPEVRITESGVTTIEGGTSTLDLRRKRAVVRRYADGRVDSLDAVVGERFHVIQNDQVLSLIQGVVDSSDAVWGAVGATHGGARTFAQLLFPKTIEIGGRDPVDLSLVVRNFHDGSGSLIGVPTVRRLWCSNQLPTRANAAIKFSIRHTASAQDYKLADLRAAIGLTFKVGNELQELGDALIAQPVTRKEFLDFVDVIYPVAKDKDGNETDHSYARRDAVQKLYFTEPDQENIRGTRWGVLQAVTAYEDWGRPVRRAAIHTREARIIDRASDAVKLRALDLLTA